MRPSRRSPTVRSRRPPPSIPNVSTPSQRSTPPRIDARTRGATHSDNDTCAPRRRDVGMTSVRERLPLGERIDAPQTAPRSGRRKRRADARTPGPEAPPDRDALAAAGQRATRHLHLTPNGGNRLQERPGSSDRPARSDRSATVARSSTSPDGTGTNVSSVGRCGRKLAQLTSRPHEALPREHVVALHRQQMFDDALSRAHESIDTNEIDAWLADVIPRVERAATIVLHEAARGQQSPGVRVAGILGERGRREIADLVPSPLQQTDSRPAPAAVPTRRTTARRSVAALHHPGRCSARAEHRRR